MAKEALKTEEKPAEKKQSEQKSSGWQVHKPSATLFDVETLAGKHNLPGWETAALMRSARWAPGKQVSEDDFTIALDKFRSRPQGGGRI
jgi:hypothetical protein